MASVTASSPMPARSAISQSIFWNEATSRTTQRAALLPGAESYMPDHREKIEQAFGRPVYERYGARDVGYIAFQLDPYCTLDYEVDWANFLLSLRRTSLIRASSSQSFTPMECPCFAIA